MLAVYKGTKRALLSNPEREWDPIVTTIMDKCRMVNLIRISPYQRKMPKI